MDYQSELEKIAAGEIQYPQQPYRSLIPFILTQEELSAQDIPPRQFLLSEWMPKDSFGMVYAPRGVGKSWFCMALAVAISEGKKRFLGWELHSQHKVLYVDGEMARVDLKERFEGLCEAPNPKLHILASEMLYREGRPLSLDFIEEQQAVDDALGHLEDKGCHTQVIIFDNLSTLRRSVSENDNDAAKQLIDWFVNLRHRGYTVIVVHHAGKSGQQRGASVLEVPMDFVIKLSQKDRTNIGKFHEARTTGGTYVVIIVQLTDILLNFVHHPFTFYFYSKYPISRSSLRNISFKSSSLKEKFLSRARVKPLLIDL